MGSKVQRRAVDNVLVFAWLCLRDWLKRKVTGEGPKGAIGREPVVVGWLKRNR